VHYREPFNGDVFTQNARLDRHASLCKLVHGLGVQDADLALWPPSVSITFHTKVGYQAGLSPRQLAELLFGVGVDRYETRHYPEMVSVRALVLYALCRSWKAAAR
jgi:hypothetical protein